MTLKFSFVQDPYDSTAQFRFCEGAVQNGNITLDTVQGETLELKPIGTMDKYFHEMKDRKDLRRRINQFQTSSLQSLFKQLFYI